LDGTAFGVSPTDRVEEVSLLGVNDDMREFLAAHVSMGMSDQQKVQRILKAILSDGLQLSYDNSKTLTAEEAFYAREGNCMSFTNLFVALAREAGVEVYYQEVEVPPSWEAQGNTWLYNKHLNAVVDLPGTAMMVDFALDVVETDHRRQLISDQEAQARYHNNMGVHYMTQNDFDEAFRHFRHALTLEPLIGYFWTNLGTLYRRMGLLDAAEQSYLIAVDLTAEPAAMSNLARLYRQRGPEELAQWYEAKVQVFRRKNPYYVYGIAQRAYEAGDYETAVREVRIAINRRQGEPAFHHLLGMSFLRLGKLDAAEEQISLAAEFTENERERATYNRKLELLAKR
jgi:Flp pilus assembly protein TadD